MYSSLVGSLPGSLSIPAAPLGSLPGRYQDFLLREDYIEGPLYLLPGRKQYIPPR